MRVDFSGLKLGSRKNRGKKSSKKKTNILDTLTKATIEDEGLIKGQTPIRDENLSKGGREAAKFKNTVLGVPIDWERWRNAPKERKNFYYVKPKKVPTVINRQYHNYFRKPPKYGLSKKSTLEDVVKTFDPDRPKGKLDYLKQKDIDTNKLIKDYKLAEQKIRIPTRKTPSKKQEKSLFEQFKDFIGPSKKEKEIKEKLYKKKRKQIKPILKTGEVAGKSLARGFEQSMMKGVGNLAQWIGENIKRGIDKPVSKSKIEESIKKGELVDPTVDFPGFRSDLVKNLSKKVGSKLTEIGKDAQKFWLKESMRGIEKPDPKLWKSNYLENPSVNRTIGLIAQAIPSLATATAITYATKNPFAGASALGLLDGSTQYIQARKQGKSVEYSNLIGGVSTIGTSLLETLPLARFLRGGSRRVTKDILVGAGQEGTQEALQQGWQNLIAKIGYDRARRLTQGVVEGFIAGAGSGGALGGFTSGQGIKTDGLIKEAKKHGATDREIDMVRRSVANQLLHFDKEIDDILTEGGKYIKEKIKGEKGFARIPSKKETRVTKKKKGRKGLSKGKIKPVLHEATGFNKLEDRISERESRVLRRKYKAQKKGAREGYKAGKREIRARKKVKREISKAIDRLKNATRKNLPPEYSDAIKSELSDIGITSKGRPLRAKYKLREFLNEQREKGAFIPIPEDRIEMAEYTDLGNVTLDLLRNKVEVMQSIIHQGRLKNKLLGRKEKRDFNRTVNKLSKKIFTNFNKQPIVTEKVKPKVREGKESKFSFVLDKIDNYFAWQRKAEFLSKSLDNFKLGETWNNIIDPIQEVANKEKRMTQTDLGNFKKTLDTYSKKELTNFLTKKIEIDDELEVTKEEAIGVYLNSKNEDNRARLQQRGNKLTDEQINKTINILNNRDKKVANLMQQIVSKKYKATDEIKRKITGNKLGEVEGYWPIIKDGILDAKYRVQQGEEDLFQSYMDWTYVDRGHTKSRTSRSKGPLNLKAFRVFSRHVQKANHFITHAIPIRNVQKIINDPRFQSAVENTMGKNIYKQFKPWLKSIANPRTYPMDSAEKFARWIRYKSTGAMLGFKASVALVQPFSYTQTIAEVGGRYATEGLLKYYNHPIKLKQFIDKNSTQVRTRRESFNREMRDSLRKGQLDRFITNRKSAKEIFFAWISQMDKLAVYPTWYSAYLKQLSKTNNYEKAKKYADHVVRTTQPAAEVKDLAQVMKGSQWQKLWTMFMSHFANVYNQLAQANDRLKWSDKGTTKSIGRFARDYWWLAILPGLLSGFVRSGFTKKKPMYYLKTIIGYALGGLIGVRDLANAILWGFTNLTTPAAQGPKEIAEAGRGVAEKEPKEILEHGVKALGYLTGTPTPQAWITMEGLLDIASGEDKAFRKLLFSEYYLKRGRKKEPKGTLTPSGGVRGISVDFSGINL